MKIIFIAILMFVANSFALEPVVETKPDSDNSQRILLEKSKGKKVDLNVKHENCSAEDYKALLKLTTDIVGIMGMSDVQITKLFLEPEYSKTNLETLKKQKKEISKKFSAEIVQKIKEIEGLIKDKPDCDKEKIFSLKKETK